MNISFNPSVIVLGILLCGCGHQPGSENIGNMRCRSLVSPAELKAFSHAFELPMQINISDSLNYIDQNGLKQGLHITRGWKNKIICQANYVDDTLNGCYREWNGYEIEGNMLKGKREGVFITNYDKGYVMYMAFYDNGQLIWTAPHIANQKYIAPIKPFSVHVDSIFLEIDHPNGLRWYEGLFLDRVPVGNHVVYNTNGALRGTIVYDTQIDSTIPWYDRHLEYTVLQAEVNQEK